MIEKFKKVMHEGMIANFEEDGFLTPVMFFIKNGQPVVSQIPNEMLKTSEKKAELSSIIKSICTDPMVTFAGIVLEAYGAKMGNDSELSKLVVEGNIRVSELKEKQDIIIMIHATPEKEETVSYVVDPENKTVGEKFIDDSGAFKGIFSNFFNTRKN